MTFIPEIEKADATVLEKMQMEKLQALLHYVSSSSPFYQDRFAALGVDVNKVTSLEAWRSLPTTSKDDLQLRNWDFLCVPRKEIVEYTSTSGTMGKPVTIALTAKDIERLAYNESISFQCAEGDQDDLYQLMVTLDRQFMAGMAYYEGIRKLGAGLVRVGPGLPAMQWESIDRLKPTVLVSVPSFIVKLIEFAEQNSINLNASSVRRIICIGEPVRLPDLKPNALATRITSSWNVRLFGTYASTEMQTAFTECSAAAGGHLHPDLLYVEILDDAGNTITDGPGEVTITTLGVQGMPLVRYRTGDIASAHTSPCSCGRTSLRLGPVVGRKQQMIKLKGTTLYPPAIFDIVQQVGAVEDFVVEVSTGKLDTDEVVIFVLAREGRQGEAESALRAIFQSRVRVVPETKFITRAELDQLQLAGASRKVRRFIDHRGI